MFARCMWCGGLYLLWVFHGGENGKAPFRLSVRKLFYCRYISEISPLLLFIFGDGLLLCSDFCCLEGRRGLCHPLVRQGLLSFACFVTTDPSYLLHSFVWRNGVVSLSFTIDLIITIPIINNNITSRTIILLWFYYP